MTCWAWKWELGGISQPAFPNQVLSLKAATIMSLMTLSLSLYPSYFIPSTSLPYAFEIAAIHSYSHPHPPLPTTSRLMPFNTFRHRRVPLEPTPLPLPASSTPIPSSSLYPLTLPRHSLPLLCPHVSSPPASIQPRHIHCH